MGYLSDDEARRKVLRRKYPAFVWLDRRLNGTAATLMRLGRKYGTPAFWAAVGGDMRALNLPRRPAAFGFDRGRTRGAFVSWLHALVSDRGLTPDWDTPALEQYALRETRIKRILRGLDRAAARA